MLYMVIERYSQGPEPVYRRASERGRMLPEGLRYIDSWVVDDEHLDRCFQLMETDDVSLIHEWILNWADLGTFEIYPVIDSTSAAGRVGASWGGGTGPAGASPDGGPLHDRPEQ